MHDCVVGFHKSGHILQSPKTQEYPMKSCGGKVTVLWWEDYNLVVGRLQSSC